MLVDDVDVEGGGCAVATVVVSGVVAEVCLLKQSIATKLSYRFDHTFIVDDQAKQCLEELTVVVAVAEQNGTSQKAHLVPGSVV